MAIEVPRDRAGTFEPQIVRKRQRRLTGVDQIVLFTACYSRHMFVWLTFSQTLAVG